MSRYSRLDTDEERLPAGMQRVGYDADSQKYTYQDSDGSLWTGRENEEYGRLLPQNGNTTDQISAPIDSQDVEQRILRHNEEIDDDTRQAWRYFLPGILIILVVLVLAWKLF